jgi:hypothetical protein
VKAPKRNALLSILIALGVVVVLALVLREYRACDRQGGTLVRGVIWYECIP